jgi:hypothetical protein
MARAPTGSFTFSADVLFAALRESLLAGFAADWASPKGATKASELANTQGRIGNMCLVTIKILQKRDETPAPKAVLRAARMALTELRQEPPHG